MDQRRLEWTISLTSFLFWVTWVPSMFLFLSLVWFWSWPWAWTPHWIVFWKVSGSTYALLGTLSLPQRHRVLLFFNSSFPIKTCFLVCNLMLLYCCLWRQKTAGCYRWLSLQYDQKILGLNFSRLKTPVLTYFFVSLIFLLFHHIVSIPRKSFLKFVNH